MPSNERLRYYGNTTIRQYQSNHKCMCCKKSMYSYPRPIRPNMYCSLLCIDCITALQKYRKGMRLLKEQNRILECISYAIR